MHRIPRFVTLALCLAIALAAVPLPAGAAVSPLRVETISFADAERGMLAGGFGNQTGFVSTTEDGGRNWHAVRVDSNRWYRAGAMGEGTDSAVVADLFSGRAVATTDLGASWLPEQVMEQQPWFHGADMEGAARGWLVGQGGSGAGEPAVIYTTANGGSSWTKTFDGPFYENSLDPSMPPRVDADAYLRAVDGADANTAWAVGRWHSSPTSPYYMLIKKTVDGGSTWTTQSVAGDTGAWGEVYSVSAPSTSHAFASGAVDRVYSTVDGGANWSVKTFALVAGPVLYDISMVGTSTGWAVGGGSSYTQWNRVYKTTDGWATRTQQTVIPLGTNTVLRSVHAIDADRAWVVGDNEVVMYTTDGGATWKGSLGNKAPSALITSPATGTVLAGTSASVTGTATDGVGTGVATVSVSITRDDGRYWSGSAWQSTRVWLNAASADLFDHWSYGWSLEPGQNRERSYSLAWRAVDAVTNEGTSGAVVSGLRVDNVGPTLISAYQVDSTHVRAVFSEPIQAASIVPGGFTIASLTVGAVSAVPTASAEVVIGTSDQAVGNTYELVVAQGAVDDPYGNASSAGSDDFTASGGGSPVLTVTQGSSEGRPAQPFHAAPGATVVVDQIVLGAHVATATVQSVTVEATGSSAASFASDVAVVSLVDDNDADGRISAGDTTAAAGPAAGTAVTLDLGGLQVASDTTHTLLIVYTLSSAAVDSHELGSRVATVAVQAPAIVDPFAPIVSAGSGGTLLVDAIAPNVVVAFPAAGALLPGPSAAIAGSVTETGSGLASMRVSIAREDGQYWNGAGWSSSPVWNAVAEGPTWTYAWALDAGQSGEHDYDITVGAFDAAGLLGESTAADVRVDNIAPELTGATAVDATHFDATFSERIATATASYTNFAVPGLTLSGAVLQPGGTTVRLTVAGAQAGARYSVLVLAGKVTDAIGNGCAAASRDLVAPGAAREAGATRYDTAVAISQATYRAGECTNAVLATGEGFPDALAASGLAGTVGGPLLLARTASLPSAVATELVRLGVTKVWLTGGTGALSASIEASLAALDCDVERVAGANRYATAAAVAAKVAELRGPAFAGRAFLARGDDFADALAVAPASAAQGFPVLLTRTSALPAETAAAVTALDIGDIVVVGGTGAVSDAAAAEAAALGAVVTREAGANRYDTAAKVASRCVTEGWLDDAFAGVATGRSFADALGGGVSAGAKNGVLLLTDPSSLSAPTSAFISAHPSLAAVAVFGGTGAVSPTVLAQIDALL